MQSNNYTSYLTFNQSSAIKGVLMLLIMLGHNHLLAPIGEQLFNYLYNFHVFGFFILPFLYNKKNSLDFKIVINNFVKIWVPYIVFFLISYLIYHIVILKKTIDIIEILYGIVSANERTIKDISGFGFLWFLPAYYSMFLFMILFENTKKYTYVLFFLVGLILNYNLSFTFNNLFSNIPFALIQGFYYFTFGYLTKLLLDKIQNIQYYGAFTFLIISILFWFSSIKEIRYIFPISGFLFIYSLRNVLSKIPLLVEVGKLSFPIYLVHVIIYNILEKILPKDMLFGYIDFILTLAMSIFIAYWIVKVDLIRKLVFPKDWNDYKSLFFH